MTHLQQFDGLKLPDSIRYLDAVDTNNSKISANEMRTPMLELVSLLHRLKVSIFWRRGIGRHLAACFVRWHIVRNR